MEAYKTAVGPEVYLNKRKFDLRIFEIDSLEWRDGKEIQLLELFVRNSCTKELWKQFINHEASSSLKKKNPKVIIAINKLVTYTSLHSISRWEVISAKKLMSMDAYNWKRLLKYFGTYVLLEHIAKLPENKRPDIEKIQQYLSDPTDIDNLLYINFDCITYWRDIFIKENIKIALECAKTVRKTLKIVIGYHHYDDIKSFLESEGCSVKGCSIKLEYEDTETGIREGVAMLKVEAERMRFVKNFLQQLEPK